MDCWRLGGTYRSTIEGMPSMYGSYIYSITYLKKLGCDNFQILTERGIIYKTRRPNEFFSKKNDSVDGLIIDYIIHIDAFLDWDKNILNYYCAFLKNIGINKKIDKPITFNIVNNYDRNLAINELLHIKKLINKSNELRLVFLNTNITNLYKL